MNRIAVSPNSLFLIPLPLLFGYQVLSRPWIATLFAVYGLVIIGLSIPAIIRPVDRPLYWPALIILLGIFGSSVFNFRGEALSRLLIGLVGLCALVSLRISLDDVAILAVLACGFWLMVPEWENSNVMAAWVMIFSVGVIQRVQQTFFDDKGLFDLVKAGRLRLAWVWASLWIGPIVVMALLGSRGGFMGLTVALIYLMKPDFTIMQLVPVSMILPVVMIQVTAATGLKTAGYRLVYWVDALLAGMAHPLAGVGPGGLISLKLITEPGVGHQIHAHNFILSTAAEGGLIGLACLGLAVLLTLRMVRAGFRLSGWRTAILMGLLAHSLIDQPLFWPGLLIFAGGLTNEAA